MLSMLARHRGRTVAGFAGLASLAAVATHIYNAARHNADTFWGDQWFWLTNVITQLDNGRLSMFEAITFEYEPLAHSHIPTLATMILNQRLLGLDTTVDRVIGVLALAAIVAIVVAHLSADDRHSNMGRLALAATVGIAFMSLAPSNFIWSLLHFQIVYVAIGVAYMWRFGRWMERPSHVWPLVVIPVVMSIGGATGIAGVVAGALYLFPFLVIGRVPWKYGATVAASILGSIVILGPLLKGQREHGGAPLFEFLKSLVTDPVEPLHALYLALAQAFVGLHPDATGYGPIRWDLAALWFAAGMVLVGLAAWGLRRAGVTAADHFPLMLIVATLFWTLGVVRSRVWFFGPEGTMHQPRYGINTTLLGIGVLMLLVQKRAALRPPARRLAAGLMALVIVANLAGSVSIALDDSGVEQQDRELAALRAYIEGDREKAPILGLACSDWAPCFEAGTFMWAERLGPFSNDPEPPSWYPEFRDAVYDRFHETADADKPALCGRLAAAPTDQLVADISDDDGLGPALAERGVVVPAADLEAAATLTGRAMASSCREFTLLASLDAAD